MISIATTLTIGVVLYNIIARVIHRPNKTTYMKKGVIGRDDNWTYLCFTVRIRMAGSSKLNDISTFIA